METRVAFSTKLQFFEGLGKVKIIYFAELEITHFSDAITSFKLLSSNEPCIK